MNHCPNFNPQSILPINHRYIKLYITIVLLLASIPSFSQPVFSLTNGPSPTIQQYALLPDAGFTINGLATDSTLAFVADDSIRPTTGNGFWLRIIAGRLSPGTDSYNLSLRPLINSYLYILNPTSGQWTAQYFDFKKGTDGNRNRLLMACRLRGPVDTLYVKIEQAAIQEYGYSFRPLITIERQAVANKREFRDFVTWIVTLTILCMFFLNTIFLYFGFRDRSMLHYLIALLGCMAYITSYGGFDRMLFASPVFTTDMLADGTLRYFDLTNLIMQVSVVMIVYGMAKLTESYLQTQQHFPAMHRVLRYGVGMYGLLTLSILLVNLSGIYFEDEVLVYSNLLVLMILSAIIYTSIKSYMRKLPTAGVFLLANTLPLGFIVVVACYHVFVDFKSDDLSLIIYVVIVLQAIVFSIALLIRIKAIKKNLHAKEQQALQLEYEIRDITLRHQSLTLSNQEICIEMEDEKTRYLHLQQKLETNQRELASSTLYIVQKNELLAGLKQELQELNKLYPHNKRQGLPGIQSILKNNFYLDSDWEKFRIHFEQVHPQFFADLQARHPSLTKNEVRLYTYFHLNLSTKEIASLLNIAPSSVRQAKTRLYKKMALPETTSPL